MEGWRFGMLRPFDDKGRPRLLIVVVFALTVASYTGIAIFATFAGAPTAAAWWLASGILLFIAAMGIYTYAMMRRERAKTR